MMKRIKTPAAITAHITDNLKEQSVYLVKVKIRANNPEHQALLFTGFKTGGYREVYANNYTSPVGIDKLYSLKVVKFLCKLK